MAAIEALLEELDARWAPAGAATLRVIGSGALMLQARYERGTKDGDVLETEALDAAARERLNALAGKGSGLSRRHGIYLEVVARGLPFLPQAPAFHPVARLAKLQRLRIEVLDVVDVAVSKLARFNATDDADIRAMAGLGLLPRARLIERFESAKERFLNDARAEDLPKIVARLHAVERDYLGAAPTPIELPDWLS